jgi:L-alanine-DL-glutamate epimerase-like enolase superfamily enzyme
LKIKVGGSAGDIERMRAVAGAAPRSRLIIDANEGWTPENFTENMAAAVSCGVSLIEQPLGPDHEHLLASLPRPVPVCADESLHTRADLERLKPLYDAVNIKLDKTGGLTEALSLKITARQMGFIIMVGCMVGTSLAMAPAVLLAQDADFADLDGPLLLAHDRDPGLLYEGSMVSPPDPALWG